VIITTHYIEEARQADRVNYLQKSGNFNFMQMVFGQIGLMRDGTLLAEDGPESLIRKFECDNLEDVFLMLSRRQEESKALGGDQRPVKTQSQYAHEHVPEIEILVRRIDNG
jgi:ABC-type multidrug transport system ATPase subunit